jgi:hypothetical protein
MQALKKETKVMLGACVDPELIKRIDPIRRLIPRSRIVEEMLTQVINAMESGKRNATTIGYNNRKR